jgi:hypothetical protein
MDDEGNKDGLPATTAAFDEFEAAMDRAGMSPKNVNYWKEALLDFPVEQRIRIGEMAVRLGVAPGDPAMTMLLASGHVEKVAQLAGEGVLAAAAVAVSDLRNEVEASRLAFRKEMETTVGAMKAVVEKLSEKKGTASGDDDEVRGRILETLERVKSANAETRENIVEFVAAGLAKPMSGFKSDMEKLSRRMQVLLGGVDEIKNGNLQTKIVVAACWVVSLAVVYFIR